MRRFGVFDRVQSKEDAKLAMDLLWTISKSAKEDLSVTKFETASFVASLEVVEQELQSLMVTPGTKAALPDGIEGMTRT